jgi:hypothetical protein
MPHGSEGEGLHLHGLRRALKRYQRRPFRKENAQVILKQFELARAPESSVNGFAPGSLTFLLGPGGQDYVGKNSYDDASRME